MRESLAAPSPEAVIPGQVDTNRRLKASCRGSKRGIRLFLAENRGEECAMYEY